MSKATYEAFYQHEKLLFSLAYRMVGTVADAEDIVQDVLIDWYPKVEQGFEVESQKAYLASMATRKSIDFLRHAYLQRESYPGTWLPEPLIASDPDEYSERMVLKDNVSMAWMLLLERLSPMERAIYILRSAFDFDYETISQCVSKHTAYCRKIMQRAQEHLQSETPHYDISDEQHRCIVQEFLEAANNGDVHTLLDTLMPDTTLISDGGGKISAALHPIYGAALICRFMLGIRKRATQWICYEIVMVNGDYGIVARDRGTIQYVMAMTFQNGKLATIYTVRNPEKLAHVFPDDFSGFQPIS